MSLTPVSAGVQQASELLKQMPKNLKPEGTGPSFSKALEQNAHTQALNQTHPINHIDLSKVQKTPVAIKSLFNNWSKDQNSMHKIMKVAMSGQNFSPGQLIMLQQATYKVTFELETMSKLVEQASSAVKTTMQTQV